MKQIAQVALLLSVAWAAHGQAAVDGFSLDQVSFAAVSSGKVPCSEFGHAGFAVRQTPGQVQYIQVVAQLAGSSAAPAWIVRNLPAIAGITSESTGVDLTLLGVLRGTCITGGKINYAVSVTDATIASAPSFALSSSSPAFVGQITDNAEGVTISGATPGFELPIMPPPPLPSSTIQPRAPISLGDLKVQEIDRAGMGNIVQGKNECAPSAVTNSLHWLQSTGAIDLKGDLTIQTKVKLENDMNFNADDPPKAQDIVVGKLAFAQRSSNPLNLNIHYQSDTIFSNLPASVTVGSLTANRDNSDGVITAEYIRQQMLKGQDIELIVLWLRVANGVVTPAGGHALALSGLLSGATGVYTNDDRLQTNNRAGLRTNHFSPLANVTINGKNYLTLVGFRPNVIIGVFAESPKPATVAVVPKENSNQLDIYDVLDLVFGPPKTSQAAAPEAGVAGSLTLVPGSPFNAGSQAVAAAGALGKFVYVTNYGSNNVSGYKIDSSTHALSPLAGSPFAAGVNPFSIATDPSGRLAYVANSGSASISVYTIDPISGALTPVAGSPFASASGPTALTVGPSGRLLFVTNNSGVSVYTIDPVTGAISVVSGSPFAAGSVPFSIAVTPNGQFVFAVNAGGGVSAYSVGASGALTSVAGSPFAAGSQPNYVAVDPTGQFLYVANFASSNVSAFTINGTTGALAAIAGSPYNVPPGPFGINVDPTGQFLYVSSQAQNPGSISAFSINPAGGTLTQISGSPYSVAGGPARLITISIPPPAGPSNPVPAVTQLAPSTVKTGSADLILTVYGNNFVPASVVRWNGAARATTFVSTTQLNVAIPAADLAAAATAPVTVSNPLPSGGNSNAVTFTISASAAPPAVPANGTLNDAGFTIGQAVSPGSIAASFGSSLASGTSTLSSPPVNTLFGAGMLFNGATVAPLFFASPGQLVFQVPWELTGDQRASATFTSPSGTSAPTTVAVAQYAPGIFTMNAAGQGAIVINATGELVSQPGVIPGFPSRPAAKGEYIAIYCTGLGDVSNRPATGAPASSDPNNLSYTIVNPTVTIGGVAAPPVFSGLAPTFVGLYQVVLQVPPGAPSGNNVPLVLTIGGQPSNTVTIAVQ